MINFSIIVFAVSAVLGLVILVRWLNKKNASRIVVYSHGIAAAAALVSLIYYAIEHPSDFPMVSLILFVLAALVGFYMFALDMKKQDVPIGIAVAHGIVAVLAFVGLLIFAFA